MFNLIKNLKLNEKWSEQLCYFSILRKRNETVRNSPTQCRLSANRQLLVVNTYNKRLQDVHFVLRCSLGYVSFHIQPTTAPESSFVHKLTLSSKALRSSRKRASFGCTQPTTACSKSSLCSKCQLYSVLKGRAKCDKNENSTKTET